MTPPLAHRPLEALDPSAGVDQLLTSGVERMARRADLDVDLVLGGASDELVPARAGHVRFGVRRVDFSLHDGVHSSRAELHSTGRPERLRGAFTGPGR